MILKWAKTIQYYLIKPCQDKLISLTGLIPLNTETFVHYYYKGGLYTMLD